METTAINWTNLYPGIDHAAGANQGYPSNNVNLLRIDLTHPALSLYATPWSKLDSDGVRTTDFLNDHFASTTMQAMCAINANYFDFTSTTRNRVHGLVISEGNVVTQPYSAQSPYGLIVTKNNQAMIGTPEEFDAFDYSYFAVRSQPWTAVAGNIKLVQYGKNVAPAQPGPLVAARTAIGLSEALNNDAPQYLFLLTIDGLELTSKIIPNQPYYGATYSDTAQWLLAAGAYNGFNLDGGGSTTMARIDKNGNAVLMNQPHNDEQNSDICERKVAISFGVIVNA